MAVQVFTLVRCDPGRKRTRTFRSLVQAPTIRTVILNTSSALIWIGSVRNASYRVYIDTLALYVEWEWRSNRRRKTGNPSGTGAGKPNRVVRILASKDNIGGPARGHRGFRVYRGLCILAFGVFRHALGSGGPIRIAPLVNRNHTHRAHGTSTIAPALCRFWS